MASTPRQGGQASGEGRGGGTEESRQIGLAQGSQPEGPGAGDAAAKAVAFIEDMLTGNGMDPGQAHEWAVASVKKYVTERWDLLKNVGLSPDAVMEKLG